jgi:hypothetical protein
LFSFCFVSFQFCFILFQFCFTLLQNAAGGGGIALSLPILGGLCVVVVATLATCVAIVVVYRQRRAKVQ